ncbi:MAG: ABC transporter substrate-binding protein [Ignavibacteriales bacterium]|nr:ABC transporter substrate-binding protein [Ignavibacteriales bacterium]
MKKLILHIFFTILIFLPIGCNQKKDTKSSKLQEIQKLKILLRDPVETLDPLQIMYGSDWKVANNIYEGLVAFTENNEIEFNLADTILISADKLNYRISLKSNIYFHDNPCFKDGNGRRLNSEDIKYSFERLATQENNFSNWEIINNKILGITEFYNRKIDEIIGIKIIDSLSLNIQLVKPYSIFIKVLASPNFYIVAKEAVEFYNEKFKYNPVGTGPFRISEFTKYDNLLLVKNKNYHGKNKDGLRLPILQSIEYNNIRETENRFGEFLKNNTHIISINNSEFQKIINDTVLLKNYNVKKIDKGVGVRYWGFYFKEGKDSESYKVLRKNIAKSFSENITQTSDQFNLKAETLVPLHFLDLKNPTLINNNKLSKNCVNSNFEVSILTNLEYRDLLILENTLSLLKVSYKRITKPNNYYEEIKNIQPTLFRINMMPAFPDPIEYYSLFYSKNIGKINLGNFSNEEFDKIFESIQYSNNQEEIQEYYTKLEKILKDEVAALYLFYEGPSYYLLNKRVNNVKFNFIIPNYSETFLN